MRSLLGFSWFGINDVDDGDDLRACVWTRFEGVFRCVRISIRGLVRRSVGRSVGRSVMLSSKSMKNRLLRILNDLDSAGQEKNLRRIKVRDGICGESANGLKNGCRRWSVWVVGQAGRSEKAFQTDSMLFLVHY